jgi:hypothetical protein
MTHVLVTTHISVSEADDQDKNAYTQCNERSYRQKDLNNAQAQLPQVHHLHQNQTRNTFEDHDHDHANHEDIKRKHRVAFFKVLLETRERTTKTTIWTSDNQDRMKDQRHDIARVKTFPDHFGRDKDDLFRPQQIHFNPEVTTHDDQTHKNLKHRPPSPHRQSFMMTRSIHAVHDTSCLAVFDAARQSLSIFPGDFSWTPEENYHVMNLAKDFQLHSVSVIFCSSQLLLLQGTKATTRFNTLTMSRSENDDSDDTHKDKHTRAESFDQNRQQHDQQHAQNVAVWIARPRAIPMMGPAIEEGVKGELKKQKQKTFDTKKTKTLGHGHKKDNIRMDDVRHIDKDEMNNMENNDQTEKDEKKDRIENDERKHWMANAVHEARVVHTIQLRQGEWIRQVVPGTSNFDEHPSYHCHDHHDKYYNMR